MTDNIYRHIVDCHCHTEYAYCGTDVTATEAITRSKQVGLRGLCFTEHAPQLYGSPEDFWEVRHINELSWRNTHGRMAEFKEFAEKLRGDGFVIAGFEVELDAGDVLTIKDEDRQWADIIIGAVHWLPGDFKNFSDGDFTEEFMRVTCKILELGVDVLAHPFRLFNSHRRQADKSMYTEIAGMLAQTDTAAEINLHHTSLPNPDFIALCIEHGVKISLGTDAHAVEELANFNEHIKILQRAAGREDIADLLYIPKALQK